MQINHHYSSSQCSCCTLVKSVPTNYSPKLNLQCEDREQLDSTVGRHAIGIWYGGFPMLTRIFDASYTNIVNSALESS